MLPWGRLFIFMGLGLLVVGSLLVLMPKIPWLGKLPGDLHIHRNGFSFYMPLTTCLILSVLLSLVFSMLKK